MRLANPFNPLQRVLSVILCLFVSTQLFAGDRYWVGGSGNWSDANHWSTKDGGQGGVGVPTADDNVFYTNNSFPANLISVVIVNTKAECKDFSFLEINKRSYFEVKKEATLSVYGKHKVDATHKGKYKGNVLLINYENGVYQKTSSGNRGTDELLHTSVNIVEIPINCDNGCDGQLTAVPVGGVGPYTYAWSTNPIQTNATATGLCVGNYTVTVRDLGHTPPAAGHVLTKAYALLEPFGFSIATDSIQPTCNGSSDGELTLNVSGGTGAYTYLWSPSAQTDMVGTGLSSGNYSITVTDQNSCDTIFTYFLDQPLGITDNGTFTNVTCFGNCDGTATIAPTGGTAPLTQLWSNGATGLTIIGQCPATYTVTITDGNGCTKEYTPTITQPAAALSVSGASTAPLCFGDCNATATATPAGGTTPYTYSWSNGVTTAGGATNTISNLCSGSYTVTITDANGCQANTTINIVDPFDLTVAESQVDLSCNAICIGTATATPAGGTGAYTYTWSTVPGQGATGGASHTATGLCALAYTYTVTDANGCTESNAITITEPLDLTVGAVKTDVTCNGDDDGTGTATPAGGTVPYTYSWNSIPAQTATGGATHTATGLAPGTYTVTVTDANGCIDSASITITEPTLLAVSMAKVDVLCATALTGSATATPSNGTAPYTYSWQTGFAENGVTSSTVNGLAAGTWTVDVTDANGCVVQGSVTITEPATALSVSVTATDVLCNAGTNGTATAAPAGGTGAYTYSWDPAPATGQTTITATNLTPNDYTVTVTDANGCTATDNDAVNDPAAITVVDSHTDASCNLGTDGTATVNPAGGTGAYTYTWSNGQIATAVDPHTIVGLTAAVYSYTVTDANGCTFTGTETVGQPAGLTFSSSKIDLTCNAVCIGQATVTPSGGTGAYTYSWNTIPAQQATGGANNTATGLCAQTYTLTVSDNSGCTNTTTVTITEPNAININVVSTTGACTSCSGAATVSASGGTGALTYAWNDPGAQTGPTATGLCQGNYTVTVTDALGCTNTLVVNVPPIVNLTVITSGGTVSCFGACDGIATATASMGTAPYTYQWDDINSQTGINATGLCAGTYNVLATDFNGCTGTAAAVFTDPAQLSDVFSFTNSTCNATNDGTATTVASGGTGAYTYSWSTSGTDVAASVTGLTPGSYTLEISDANGCSITETFTTTEPTAIGETNVVTDATCLNNDGDITVIGNGGTGPYTYTWLDTPPGGTSNFVNTLFAGIYDVEITDALGCKDTFAITVSNLNAPTTTQSQTNASCYNICDGTATVNVIAGNGPFSYSWTTGFQENGVMTSTVNGLCDGAYIVEVTDALGCIVFENYTITEPSDITFTSVVTDVLCGGTATGQIDVTPSGGTAPYNFSWSPTGSTSVGANATESNLVAGNDTVFVTDANGCQSMQDYIIAEPTVLSVTATATDITCSGFSDGNATAVAAGGTGLIGYSWSSGELVATIVSKDSTTYIVVATDANGCTASDTVYIADPPAITSLVTATDASCNTACDGTASVVAAGGTGGLSYTWQPGPLFGASQIGLCAGTYSLFVTDGNLCQHTDSAVISAPAPVTIGTSQVDVLCFGDTTGTATATPTGGTAPYDIIWSNGQSVIAAVSLTAINLSATTYTVDVTDANGCTATNTVTLTSPTDISITLSTTGSCGPCNGTASASFSGGVAPYSFSWSNGQTGTGAAANATGLCSGVVDTLTVTDANGCVKKQTFTTSPTVSFTITQTNGLGCAGACTGAASASVIGGLPPYTYLWSSGTPATNATVTGLCAGTYTLTVTDNGGCTTTQTTTFAPVLAMSATFANTNNTCYNDSNGVANPTISGGTGIYTYSWSVSGQTASVAPTGLPAGTYTLTVTDAQGCTFDTTTTITQPADISVNPVLIPATCNQADGAISLNTSGGTSPYTHVWNPNVSVGQNAFNIAAGTYTIVITDFALCSKTFNVGLSNANGPTVTSSQSNTSCIGACDGEARVTVTAGNGPYSYTWSNGANDANVLADTISALCAATYAVNVVDVNGCITAVNYTITEPAGITDNAVVSNPGCAGTATGSILVTPSGGTAPYTYTWTGGLSGANPTAVAAGTYTLEIGDASAGCSQQFIYTLTDPGVFSVDAVATNASCNATNSGSATANITGGTAPYSYTWTGTGQTTPVIAGLIAGEYTVVVTSTGGCTATDTALVKEPTTIASNMVTVQPTCGSTNGSLTSVASGGTPGYNYLWDDGSTTNPANAITGLATGNYTLTITDAAGCTLQEIVSLTNSNGPTLTTSANPSCVGGNNGSVSVSATSPNLPLTYLWSDASSQTTTTATGLGAGIYNVTVTDNIGCVAVGTADLSQPSQDLTLGFNVIVNPTCINDSGNVQVTTVGGITAYSYSWNHGPTDPFANLAAGNYTLTVTDAIGCTDNMAVSIVAPTTPTLTTLTQTQPTCGNADGSVTVDASGGTTPYSYSWLTLAQTGPTATGIAAGTYTVELTDGNSCTTQHVIALSNPNGPALVIASTDVLCYGGNNGVLSVTATGNGPFIYSWTPTGDTTATIDTLMAGEYGITAEDINGCITAYTDTIFEPNQLISNVVTANILCNGDSTGTASVTTSGGTSPYNYYWSTTPIQTTTGVTGLPVGAYALTTNDANGCQITTNFTIAEPDTIEANPTFIEPTCSVSNGQITIVPTGGTGPYTVTWSTPPGGTSTTVTGLAAGLYTVTITDNTGCTADEVIALNNAGGPYGDTINVVNASCYNSCDGQAQLTAIVGGTAPYTLSWNTTPAQTDSLATGLCAGTYQIKITDNNNCIYFGDADIAEPSQIKSNPSIYNALCTGSCDGAIKLSPSGGNGGPYVYVWTGNPSVIDSIGSVCPGYHTVTITDVNGCSFTDSIPVNPASILTIATSATNTTCNGDCDGTGIVTVTAGTGPFTYQWNDGGLQVTDTATALCMGTYDVTVTNGNGCNVTASATVASPTPINNDAIVTDANCGSCNGKIVSSVTGGTAPFTYLWTNGPTTDSLTLVCAGLYTQQIIDANGCSATFIIPVSNIGGPDSATFVTTDAACFGAASGSSVVTAYGGTTPYTYLWLPTSPLQTSATATGLTSGVYFAQITDAKGCVLIEADSVGDGIELLDNAAIVSPDCGLNNGSITLTASGGSGAGYTYTWNTLGFTTPGISNLVPGIYTATVTDGNSCTEQFIYTLGNSTPITIDPTITDVNGCAGTCNGAVTIVASGGSSPYAYSWSHSATVVGTTATGLCAGTIIVKVTDANGCVAFKTIDINEPDSIIPNIPTVIAPKCKNDCNGSANALALGGTIPFTYGWMAPAQTGPQATGLCAGSYTLTATDGAGCTATKVITLTDPSVITITSTLTQPNCSNSTDGAADATISGGTPGYTFSWSSVPVQTTEDLAGVMAGTYTITVTDANGCTKVDSVALSAVNVVLAISSNDTIYCQTITPITLSGVASVGATTYTWYQLPSTSAIGSSSTISLVPAVGATSYVLEISNGVCVDRDTVDVTVNATPIADAGEDQSVVQQKETTLGGNPTGSVGSTYSWAPYETVSDTTAPNPIATPTITTTYTVVVTGANGCMASDTVVVTVVPDVRPIGGFTPNGDGTNDGWDIGFISLFPNCTVKIFNRWGEELFNSTGYIEKWDGTAKNGKDLPVGTYYYVIELNDPLFPDPLTGTVTIMR